MWRKKGHSRGTSSVREASPFSVPCKATDGQDKILASSIIMLLVEAVKSSSSTSVSHSVTRTSCTWSFKICKNYRAIIINQKELNASYKHVHGHELESEWKIFHICDWFHLRQHFLTLNSLYPFRCFPTVFLPFNLALEPMAQNIARYTDF